MKNEDKFFTGIEDTLHAYEDAYVPGSWEAFQQKRQRSRMGMFLRLSSAAAVLLLLSYVALQFYVKSPVPVQVVQNKKDIQQPQANPSSSPAQQIVPQSKLQTESIAQNKELVAGTKAAKTADPVIATAKPKYNNETVNTPVVVKPDNAVIATAKPKYNDEKVNTPVILKPDNTIIATNQPPVKTNDALNPLQNPVKQDDAANKPLPGLTPEKVIANNDTKKVAGSAKSEYDVLVNSKNNSKAITADKKASDKTVSYAVMVQPSVGNQKLNIGTGVEVSYKLTDKISINSGIGYSSLSAISSSANGPRLGQVQNVNLQVSGFEVPIGVQYKTGGGFYVSAGVTGMSVMNNSLEYTYIGQSAVASVMTDKQGLAYNGLSAVTENKVEESKEKVSNYIGFYNLSVGKKLPLGKKNNLNIGPFLRVPFGAVSSEKIQLLQGGVKVGLGF
jgi:hypothetical protein